MRFFLVFLLVWSGVASAALTESRTYSVANPGNWSRQTPSLMLLKGQGTTSTYVMEANQTAGQFPVVATGGGPLTEARAYAVANPDVWKRATPVLLLVKGQGTTDLYVMEVDQTTGQLPVSAASSGDVTGPGVSVDSEIVLFNGTTGTAIKRATGTGVVHATSGVYGTGTVTIGEGGTGATSFTQGSVPFMGATTLEQDNANFFWDNTNNRLGIGTTSPAAQLDVVHLDPVEIRQTNLDFATNVRNIHSSYMQTVHLTDIVSTEQNGDVSGIGGELQFWTREGQPIGAPFTQKMTIMQYGNVGIGTTVPATKLEVNGVTHATKSQVAAVGSFDGVPGFGFFEDADTGIYSDAANTVKVATNGTHRFTIADTVTTVINALSVSDAGGNGGNVPHALTRRNNTSAGSATCSVTCSGGEKATGGGCANSDTSIALTDTHASADDTWSCVYVSAAGDCTAHAMCFKY